MLRPSRSALAAACLVSVLVASSCGLMGKGTDAATGNGTRAPRPLATDSSGRTLPPELQPPSEEDPPPEDGEDPPTSPTTVFVPRHFSVGGSGDILLHNYVIQDGAANAKNQKGVPYDFNPMFDGVRDLISGVDLAICHQETPIAMDNKNLTVPRTLSFNAPKEIAVALKNAGFDACENSSNHVWDRQLSGMRATHDALEAAGLRTTGSARTAEEAENPPIYEVNGVKVGHLAYTYTIYNNGVPDTKVPPEAPWMKNFLWPLLGVAGIKEQAAKLKARGAEFIVASMQWGDQYVHQPNQQQRTLARELLGTTDVDLILGDHVHVVQPCEKIGDKYVTYGMGNFLSNQSPEQDRTLVSANQDGSWQQFQVAEVAPGDFRVTKMEYAPTWVVIQGHKITKATPTTFKDSYDRTVKNMNLLGPGICDATPMY